MISFSPDASCLKMIVVILKPEKTGQKYRLRSEMQSKSKNLARLRLQARLPASPSLLKATFFLRRTAFQLGNERGFSVVVQSHEGEIGAGGVPTVTRPWIFCLHTDSDLHGSLVYIVD